MADTFFDENKVEEQTPEVPDVIKVGEKEYSPEELNRLVGLGQQAVELETKWDTKIDRLMPEFSRSREELKSYKQREEEASKAQVETKQNQGEELSEAEQRKLIRENAQKYDLMTTESFDQMYADRRAGEKLLDQTESIVSKAAELGNPKTTTEELLTYMAETGIRNPATAYEVMFKEPLREIEMQKLRNIKPNGLMTDSGSTAGAKQPNPVVVTKDNMGDLLQAVLTRGGGQ